MTFRQAYCHRFGIPENEYPRHIFRRCMYRRALLLVPFLKWLDPEYFQEDEFVIRQLGELKDSSCFRPEVGRFRGRNQRSSSILRRRLKFHVSGKRLMAFQSLLPPKAP